MSTTNTPFPVNHASDIFNKIINALMTGGEAVAEAYIKTQIPILADPLLSDMLDYLIKWLGGMVGKEEKTLIDFLVLNFQNQGQKSLVYAALAQIKNNPSGGTDAAQEAWQNIIGNWSVGDPSTTAI
jgi:hypothetical protein